MKLIVKLILGIIAGLLIGLMAPDALVRAALTAKVIIDQLINFTIPLIILFYVMSGIASLPKNSGAMLGRTVGMAYGSTILAGIFAFLVASNLLPGMLSGMAPVAEGRDALTPFLDLEIPAALPVMTALVLAFVFGVVISRRELPTLKAPSSNRVKWSRYSSIASSSRCCPCSSPAPLPRWPTRARRCRHWIPSGRCWCWRS